MNLPTAVPARPSVPSSATLLLQERPRAVDVPGKSTNLFPSNADLYKAKQPKQMCFDLYAPIIARELSPDPATQARMASRLVSTGWSAMADYMRGDAKSISSIENCREMLWAADRFSGRVPEARAKLLTADDRRFCNAALWSAVFDKSFEQGLKAVDTARLVDHQQMAGLLLQDFIVTQGVVGGFAAGTSVSWYGATIVLPASANFWAFGGPVMKTIAVAMAAGGVGTIAGGIAIAAGAGQFADAYIQRTDNERQALYRSREYKDLLFCDLVTGRYLFNPQGELL